MFDTDSIDKAIPDIINWIKNDGSYKNSFVYETMSSKLPSLSEEERKSFALRLLIHYIGDIHQPLHATARVNSKYPKGDAGGNFVSLPIKGGAKNLHSVWDSMLYEYTATPHMVSSYSRSFYSKINILKQIPNLITIIALQPQRLDLFRQTVPDHGVQVQLLLSRVVKHRRQQVGSRKLPARHHQCLRWCDRWSGSLRRLRAEERRRY